MQPEPDFAANLYRGTAESYDRFRLAYPGALVQDLVVRVRPARHGRLLDLACGTGQLAFALAGHFAVTWAVDQEPDMFQVEHRWTVTELAGFAYSTSFLAAPVFGGRSAEFEADLANHLEPHLHGGVLVDQVSFAYDLFRKPGELTVSPGGRCEGLAAPSRCGP